MPPIHVHAQMTSVYKYSSPTCSCTYSSTVIMTKTNYRYIIYFKKRKLKSRKSNTFTTPSAHHKQTIKPNWMGFNLLTPIRGNLFLGVLTCSRSYCDHYKRDFALVANMEVSPDSCHLGSPWNQDAFIWGDIFAYCTIRGRSPLPRFSENVAVLFILKIIIQAVAVSV